MSVCFSIVIFFFKQKTAYEMRISDWSSDVCSSDLFDDVHLFLVEQLHHLEQRAGPILEPDAQPRDAARTREVAQQHIGEQPGVDIAAGEDEPDLASRERIGVDRESVV